MSSPYIVPLNVGNMLWDHSEAVLRRGIGVKHEGNFICWYIGGTDFPILVDSGLPDEKRSQKYHGYTSRKQDFKRPRRIVVPALGPLILD